MNISAYDHRVDPTRKLFDKTDVIVRMARTLYFQHGGSSPLIWIDYAEELYNTNGAVIL